MRVSISRIPRSLGPKGLACGLSGGVSIVERVGMRAGSESLRSGSPLPRDTFGRARQSVPSMPFHADSRRRKRATNGEIVLVDNKRQVIGTLWTRTKACYDGRSSSTVSVIRLIDPLSNFPSGTGRTQPPRKRVHNIPQCTYQARYPSEGVESACGAVVFCFI